MHWTSSPAPPALGSSYVKPHGALYNRVVHDREQAEAVVAGVRLADASLPVLGLPSSAVHAAAEAAGLTTVIEAFADRAYTGGGTLVPRSEPGAVVTDPGHVVERAVRIARHGEVTAVDGRLLRLSARSLCLHGDTPDAARLARRVRQELDAAGVTVRAFT